MNRTNYRPCPACAGSSAKSCGEKSGFKILVCRECSSIYAHRVPVGPEVQNYDEYYNEANLSTPAFIMERMRETLLGFGPYRTTGRLLDIGFGAGTILNVARELGWEAQGLEVSQPAVEQARRMGFEVFHGDLKTASYPADHFDVVTASEIIEHLSDPVGDLRRIAAIVRPGGLFWATTPSAESLSFRILGKDWTIMAPPEHIQLYSRKGARMILRDAGFSTVRFQTHGLNPGEIKNYFTRPISRADVFDRVYSAYERNERLTRSRSRKMVKDTLNRLLDITTLAIRSRYSQSETDVRIIV